MTPIIRTITRFAVLSLLALMISNTVLAADYYRTLIFQLKPGQSQAFQDLMKVALEDTRAYEGCEYVAMLVDNDDPNKVFLYEIWDVEASYKGYSAWRTETKFVDQIGPYLAGPPMANTYTLVQE